MEKFPKLCLVEVLESGEACYLEPLRDVLKRHISNVDVVVVEDFVVRRSLIGDRVITIRAIGAIETYAAGAGKLVVFQQPIEKPQIPDQLLKRWKVYVDCPREHMNDAIRHACIFVKKQYKQESASVEPKHKRR